MNLTKRLDDIEKKLDLTGVETELQKITRQQSCIIRFHSVPKPTQQEMIRHAGRVSKTPETLRDSLQTFIRLTNEEGKTREISPTHYSLTGR